MNFKKSMIALPLSFSLILPAAAPALVSAHNGVNHEAYAQTVSTPASDLRATLDALLSEHAYLAVIVMQKGIDGSADFNEAAKALNQNTDDLSKAVASVYGEAAGKQFKDIWSSHIGYFVDYVVADSKKDQAGKDKALAELQKYKKEQAAFLDTATDSRLKAADLEKGLQSHIDQLLGAYNQYTADHFDQTYDHLRHSIHHMYGTGKGLSWAITDQFSDKFNHTKVDTKAANLRADLNYLFSEHAALAILAMQKGIDGKPDFEEAAGALNENTEDLTKAVASVYGEEAGKQFKMIWSSHIGYFVDYVNATANKDEAGKQKAMDELAEYRVEQAKFLEAATEGRLKATDLEMGLKMHVEELLNAFNSYNEKDYADTYETIREAYSHMFGVGESLSGAIVDQFPAKFKDTPAFKDVNLYKEEIAFLAEKGIVVGVSAELFAPEKPVTRLQAVTMIIRALEMNDASNVKDPGYSDVKTGDTGYEMIAKATELGIINGHNGKFHPYSHMTRAQMAKVLVKAFELKGTSNKTFKDVNKNDWHASYISILAANHITTGYGDQTFKPNQNISRQQYAAMVARVMDDSFKPMNH